MNNNDIECIGSFNNIGVSLLENSHYEQAITVLESAIKETKKLLHQRRSPGHGHPMKHSNRLSSKLHILKAYLKQGSLAIHCGKETSTYLTVSSPNPQTIVLLLQSKLMAAAGKPIKIIHDKHCNSQNTEVILSIMMYNLGLAYYICASNKNRDVRGTNYARTIFLETNVLISSRTQDEDLTHLTNNLLIGIHLHASLVFLLLDCGQTNMADRYHRKIIKMGDALAQYLKMEGMSVEKPHSVLPCDRQIVDLYYIFGNRQQQTRSP